MQLQLKVYARDVEKTVPEKLRKDGKIPAELYGRHTGNSHVFVDEREFLKVLRKAGESTLVELVTEDGKKHNVLIHDVQNHYLKSNPIHVDFLEVSMTEKLTANVPLEFEGEPRAVKELGGTLVKVLNEVEVECLPADLPHNIVVDVTNLATFEDAITVKDLPVPAKVAILTDAEETVAKVQPPRDVEAELSAPVVEDVTQVEGVVKPEAPAEDEDEKK